MIYQETGNSEEQFLTIELNQKKNQLSEHKVLGSIADIQNTDLASTVFVFKTSVRNKKKIQEIAKHFEQIPGILAWNFDLTDCDKILRIEANRNVAAMVEKKLHSLHCLCEELF